MHKCNVCTHTSLGSLTIPCLLWRTFGCLVFPSFPITIASPPQDAAFKFTASAATTNHIPKQRRKYIRGINADIDI